MNSSAPVTHTDALAYARQQIALNLVLVGLGIGLLFAPHILSFFVDPLLRLPLLILLPVGLYVSGLGVAGIIEGGIRMARSLKT